MWIKHLKHVDYIRLQVQDSNYSRFVVSSLHRVHANFFCIVLVLSDVSMLDDQEMFRKST